jgi:predicted kinase
MIVLLAGLPGTGKSALAHALSERLNGAILGKDEIRHALFAPPEIEYSSAQDDFVLQIMLEAAAWILRKHPARVVFLDGRTFSRRYQIETVLRAADQLSQPWHILECVCSEDTVRSRLEAQSASGGHPAANRTFKLYVEVKARFEPITFTKTVIDTDQSLDDCVQKALQTLR